MAPPPQNDAPPPGPMRRAARVLAGLRHPDLKFLHDLAVLAGGQVLTKILGFLLFAYLARVLPPEEYGTIEYLLAITGFAMLFVEFGLGQVGVREKTLQGEETTVVTDIPLLRALAALICIPVVVGATFLSTEDPAARTLGCLYAGSLLLYGWQQEWLMQALEQLHKVAVGQMLRALVAFVMAVLLVRGPGDMVRAGVAELIAVSAWIAYFLINQIRSGLPVIAPATPRRLWMLWRQAIPLGLNSIIWGAVQMIPPILVFNVAGAEQAAWYAAGQRIVVSLQTMSYLYHFNMFAGLIRRLREGSQEIVRLAQASTRVVAWATIGPAIFCAAYGGELMALVFGAPYAVAGPIFGVLIFAVPVQFLSGHQRWALTAAGHFNAVLITGAAGAGTALVASIMLIAPLAALGAAIAALAATTAVWIAAWILCARHGLVLPVLRYLLRPALVAGVLVAGLRLVPDLHVLARLGLGMALYAALILPVDRRFTTDLRHLAYSKKTADGAK